MPGVNVSNIKGTPISWSDVLFSSVAKETPFKSSLKMGESIRQVTHGYKVRVKRGTSSSGVSDGETVKVIKGNDAKEELTCRMGKFTEGFGVGDIAGRIDSVANTTSQKAGALRNTNATQLAQAAEDQARNIAEGMEREMLSDQEGQPDRGPGNGFKFRGLGKWLQTTAQADLPVPESVRTPAAHIFTGANVAALTEDALIAILKERSRTTGTKSMLTGFVALDIQSQLDTMNMRVQTVAGTTDVRQQNMTRDEVIRSGVKFFESSWGKFEVHWDLFLPTNERGYLLDMEHIRCHPFAEGTWNEPLAADGTGDKQVLKACHLWHPGDPRAHIVIKPQSEVAV